MSNETLETLNQRCLIGQVAKYGKPWHYSEAHQGEESNLYEGGIPIEDVERRLFNWQIVKRPVYLNNPVEVGGGRIDQLTQIPNAWAIGRSDNDHVFYFGTDIYDIHQYKEALFDAIQEILAAADGDIVLVNALSLQEGGVAALQLELAEPLRVLGEELRPFYLGSTSCNGTLATTYQTGTERTVCDNTLAAARAEGFGNGSTYKVKHTVGSNFSADKAREVWGILVSQKDAEEARLRRLVNTAVTPRQVQQFVDTFFPKLPDDAAQRAQTARENKVEAFRDLYHDDPRVGNFKGTAWGLFQAASTYNLHLTTVRKGKDDPLKRVERNLLNFVKGDIQKADDKALALIGSLTS